MPIRVFLVEDMMQMHGVLQDLLGAIGDFAVVQACSTEAEAKFWLDENTGGWDLAVVDLILEQGSGMGVIQRCKARGPGKVVVLSDYATPGIRHHCERLGADAVFQKGQDMQAFIEWCSELSNPEAASV